jgi:TRAP-type C4-dicarboxylate transport system permease small subunit
VYDCKAKRLCDKVSKILALAGGVGLTLMMLLVVTNILTRKLFNSPIYGATELVRYLSLFVGSVGLFRLEWGGGNIRMTLLLDSVKKRTGCLIEFIANTLGCIGFGFVTCYMFRQTAVKFSDGSITEALQLPMWVPYGVLSIGFAILTVCIGIKAALWITSFFKRPLDPSPPSTQPSDPSVI